MATKYFCDLCGEETKSADCSKEAIYKHKGKRIKVRIRADWLSEDGFLVACIHCLDILAKNISARQEQKT